MPMAAHWPTKTFLNKLNSTHVWVKSLLVEVINLYIYMVASLSVLVGEFAHKVATLKEQLGNQLLSVVESFRKKNTEMKRDR